MSKLEDKSQSKQPVEASPISCSHMTADLYAASVVGESSSGGFSEIDENEYLPSDSNSSNSNQLSIRYSDCNSQHSKDSSSIGNIIQSQEPQHSIARNASEVVVEESYDELSDVQMYSTDEADSCHETLSVPNEDDIIEQQKQQHKQRIGGKTVVVAMGGKHQLSIIRIRRNSLPINSTTPQSQSTAAVSLPSTTNCPLLPNELSVEPPKVQFDNQIAETKEEKEDGNAELWEVVKKIAVPFATALLVSGAVSTISILLADLQISQLLAGGKHSSAPASISSSSTIDSSSSIDDIPSSGFLTTGEVLFMS